MMGMALWACLVGVALCNSGHGGCLLVAFMTLIYSKLI